MENKIKINKLKHFREGQEQDEVIHCLFKVVLVVLASAIRQEQGKRIIQMGYKDIKVSLFEDIMFIYIKDAKVQSKRIPRLKKLINEKQF